jgi:hypothetical protein
MLAREEIFIADDFKSVKARLFAVMGWFQDECPTNFSLSFDVGYRPRVVYCAVFD